MIWASDWIWGIPLLVGTVVFHVAAVILITRALVSETTQQKETFVFVASVALLALATATLHAMEALAWAVLYVHLGALSNLADAMLYSLSALTAFGHANIFLEPRWQLLGAIEAVNGLIVFGLSTAFFFSAIQKAGPSRQP